MDTAICADVSLGIAPDTITFVLDNRPTVFELRQAQRLVAVLPAALALADQLRQGTDIPSDGLTTGAQQKIRALPALGDPFLGGFFGGLDIDHENVIIFAPKASGQVADNWKDALAFCRALTIGGFTDWSAPDRDDAYLLNKRFNPRLTTVEAFMEGNPEAFDREWHWTSTQSEFTAVYAWFQDFGTGYQLSDGKVLEYPVRAVRKVPLFFL